MTHCPPQLKESPKSISYLTVEGRVDKSLIWGKENPGSTEGEGASQRCRALSTFLLGRQCQGREPKVTLSQLPVTFPEMEKCANKNDMKNSLDSIFFFEPFKYYQKLRELSMFLP